jgi:hypothetical protein
MSGVDVLQRERVPGECNVCGQWAGRDGTVYRYPGRTALYCSEDCRRAAEEETSTWLS